MKKINKYLALYALAATAVAGLMTYNTVKLVDAAGVVEYEKPEVEQCPTLQEQLESRAHELREDPNNKAMDLEKYRQEALREVNQSLQAELGNSPFINYEELEAKHGY